MEVGLDAAETDLDVLLDEEARGEAPAEGGADDGQEAEHLEAAEGGAGEGREGAVLDALGGVDGEARSRHGQAGAEEGLEAQAQEGGAGGAGTAEGAGGMQLRVQVLAAAVLGLPLGLQHVDAVLVRHARDAQARAAPVLTPRSRQVACPVDGVLTQGPVFLLSLFFLILLFPCLSRLGLNNRWDWPRWVERRRGFVMVPIH